MNARSKLIGKLDRLFSIIVRNKDAVNGTNICYTCGQVLPIKELQCGHFISRRYFATRWDFDNVRVQCYECNVVKQGNLKVFEQKLRNEIGNERLNQLARKAKSLSKFSTLELHQLLIDLTEIAIKEKIRLNNNYNM
jgi:hypothetical protein